MKTVKRIVGLLVLLGLGWLSWQHFFPNDEHHIRRMLDGLAETLSIPANESVVGIGIAVDKLLGHVMPDIEVDVEVPGEGRHAFSGREEVRDAELAAHRNWSDLKVQFLDVNVALAADKQTATVELTAKAAQRGAKELLVQEVKLQLRQTDGKWHVSRAETIKPLKL